MALNETQKNILNTVLLYQICTDSISSSLAAGVFEEFLENIIKYEETESAEDKLKKQELLQSNLERIGNIYCNYAYENRDSMKQIFKIMTHPCPQNRTTGSPYVGQELGMAVWKDEDGNIQREPVGLLSLTANSDNTATPVTRNDVAKYITSQIEESVTEIKNKVSFLKAVENGDIPRVTSMIDQDWVTKYMKDSLLFNNVWKTFSKKDDPRWFEISKLLFENLTKRAYIEISI